MQFYQLLLILMKFLISDDIFQRWCNIVLLVFLKEMLLSFTISLQQTKSMLSEEKNIFLQKFTLTHYFYLSNCDLST